MIPLGLLKRFREFANHDGGNIAGTFALSFLPLLGMVGAAIDYGQLSNTRSALKQAADLTAISMSKVASSSSAADLQTAGENFFKSNVIGPVTNIVVSVTYSQETAEITVEASGGVDTAVMKAFNIPSLNTSVRSKASFGGARLRVALAIDVTGSMDSDGKMDATKTATKKLIDQLQQAGSANGDVFVSLVPFNRNVNIGSSNSNATWLDWSEYDEDHGTCRNSKGKKKNEDTATSCKKAGYTWTADRSDWNGCVMDRTQNFDTTATIPTSIDIKTYFPPDQYSSCPAQMQGLTNDFAGLKTLVDSLNPTGNTNQGIGFAWAWQTLVGGANLSIPPKEADYQYEDIIILMSDGMNTQNRWYKNASQIDARQKIACDNAKAAGYTVYTVQVNTDNDSDSAVLAYCASDDKKFKIAKNAPEILTTFEQIGNGLNKARLSE